MYNFIINNKISIISFSTVLIASIIYISNDEALDIIEQKFTEQIVKEIDTAKIKNDSKLISEMENDEMALKKLNYFQDTVEQNKISENENIYLEINDLENDRKYIEVELSDNVKPKEENFDEINQIKINSKARVDGFIVENTTLLEKFPSHDNINVNLEDEYFNEIDQMAINGIGIADGTIIPQVEENIKVVNEVNISEKSNDALDLEIDQQVIIENAKLQGLI